MRAKPMLVALLMAMVGGVMTLPALAAETCPYTLSQKIYLTPEAVELQGKTTQLRISNEGEVSRNQQPLTLDLAAQQ
ncbi:MAG: hypothetical protein ACRDCK_05115, partial [Plesiomonas shigelloides]